LATKVINDKTNDEARMTKESLMTEPQESPPRKHAQPGVNSSGVGAIAERFHAFQDRKPDDLGVTTRGLCSGRLHDEPGGGS